MNKLRWINTLLVWIAIGVLSAWIYEVKGKQKTAFVQLNKVYNEFRMTKELESQFTAVENKRKQLLDSLKLQLNVLAAGKKPEQLQLVQEKQEVYYNYKTQFEQDNAEMTRTYTQQIMKQLSQYVREYGQQQGYAYIYGADGTGVVMHADEQLDVTDEVVQFINKRYKGFSK